jgi:molybdopterin-guanine dinucleotide biosynthesis protein A
MVRSYVLCGGRSRRFGRDKARVEVRGRPLLLHVAHRMDSVASPVTAVAERAGAYEDLGLRTLGDRHPHAGPLAGILVALEDAANHHAQAALIAPTDLLDLPPAWLRLLVQAARGAEPGGRSAAFRGPQGIEPLPLVLDVRAVAEVDRHLNGPDRSIRGLLDDLPLETPPRPPDWDRCRRITTPGDLPPEDGPS